jgi:cytochrome P450
LFADGEPADLIERFARKLPLSVICELLGLPLADRPKFLGWASGFTRAFDQGRSMPPGPGFASYGLEKFSLQPGYKH